MVSQHHDQKTLIGIFSKPSICRFILSKVFILGSKNSGRATFDNFPALSHLLFLGFLLIAVLASLFSGKLTFWAGITGAVVATCIYLGAGWSGIAMLSLFFILGTAATSFKKNWKQKITGTSETGARNAGQVLANGGAAALFGLLVIFFPEQKQILLLMMAGAFSSATADTLSSELGTVYGQRFYNILNFKNDRRGLDGVVSMEGFLFGLTGSAIIAMVFALCTAQPETIVWIIIAGTAGNLADSYLGAALERKNLIHNDLVNFFNTTVGATVMLLA